ncbi:MAG TPA: hypothetical protein VGL53_09700 [Bryobacteraceae bacterium]|jgi:hypothetical protein
MLKSILALLPLAVILHAQPERAVKTVPYEDPHATAKSAPARPAATATTKQGPVNGIPAGAVKVDENTYRYQEKDAAGKPGKVWLFRRNPFGVSKIEEKDDALNGKVLPSPETPTTAKDLGDSYRFERSGPFGSKVWTKKKSELNADERAIIEKPGAVTPKTVQKATN